jgi:hypothetical protein
MIHLTDQECEMREMSVGQLLDLLEDFNPNDLSRVNALLRKILIHAAGFYDDGCECDLRCSAVYLAYLAILPFKMIVSARKQPRLWPAR